MMPYVWQRVRFVRVQDPQDPLADDFWLVGKEGVVIAGARYFPDDPEAGYDCVVSFPGYSEYCAWAWQLVPLTPPGLESIEEALKLWEPQGETA